MSVRYISHPDQMKAFALETRMATVGPHFQPPNASKPIRSVYDDLVLSILSPISEPDILKACRTFTTRRTFTNIDSQKGPELLDINHLVQRWMGAIGLYYATKRVIFDINLPAVGADLYSTKDKKPASIHWLGECVEDGAIVIDISAVEDLVMGLAVAIKALVDGSVQFEVKHEQKHGISHRLEAWLRPQLAHLSRRRREADAGPAEQPKAQNNRRSVPKSRAVDRITDMFQRVAIWTEDVHAATTRSQAAATTPRRYIVPPAREAVVRANIRRAASKWKAEVDAATTTSPQAADKVRLGPFGTPLGRAVVYNHLEGSVPIPSAQHLSSRPETGESQKHPGSDVEAAKETATSKAECGSGDGNSSLSKDYEMVDADQLDNDWEVV
jgi:hypothetical protein